MHDTGTNIEDRFPPGFRQGIGEAIALQYLGEKERLLVVAALQTNIFQQAIVVLGNLT